MRVFALTLALLAAPAWAHGTPHWSFDHPDDETVIGVVKAVPEARCQFLAYTIGHDGLTQIRHQVGRYFQHEMKAKRGLLLVTSFCKIKKSVHMHGQWFVKSNGKMGKSDWSKEERSSYLDWMEETHTPKPHG